METWKDIQGYEGYYQVSDLGNVRSLDRIVVGNGGGLMNLKGKQLRKCFDGRSYSVMLSREAITRRRTVQRLVAETFIGNPENKPEVNHIDGNPRNNELSNLEWVTPKENMQHAKKYLGCSKEGMDNRRSIGVSQFDRTGRYIRSFGSVNEAAKVVGVSAPHISEVKAGKRKTEGGFIWKCTQSLLPSN